MARRSTIFDDFSKLPWQVGVIMAVLCYPAAILLKTYFASNPVLVGLGIAVSAIWPIFSALFLLAAFISFVSDRDKSSIFKSHRSIEKIRSLTWQQFEQFVGSYFKGQGYSVMETAAGPDGGVDLVLRKDGGKTYVQCKHWKANKVRVEKVRELLGAMAAGGADHGVFVTTGEFTLSAKQFGGKHGVRLIDGKELEYLLRSTPAEDTLSPDIIANQPECPVCKSVMVKRTAKKGPNRGSQFWGCSRFPGCRSTRKV